MRKLSVHQENARAPHELMRSAEAREQPANLENASPFPNRRKVKDPIATVVLAAAAVAMLAFLISMLGLFQIHGPR